MQMMCGIYGYSDYVLDAGISNLIATDDFMILKKRTVIFITKCVLTIEKYTYGLLFP